MRRRLLIAAVCLIVALAAATDLYLHSAAFRSRVEAYVVGQIEAGSGARVSVQGFLLQIWPPRLELQNLTAHGRETARQPPLAAIPRLVITLRPGPLLRGQILFQRIEVTAPRFRVYRLGDGLSNLPLPQAAWQRRQQEAQTLFQLGTERLDVAQGELDLADRRIPLELHLAGLRLRAAAGASGSLSGHLRFAASGLRWAQLPPLAATADLQFVLRPNGLTLNPVRIDAAGMVISAQASVPDFTHPRLTLVYQAQVDGSALSRAVQLSPPLLGQVQMTGTAAWVPGTWQIAGLASADHLGRAGADQVLGSWSTRLRFLAGPRGLQVPEWHLRGLGGEAVLHGEWQDWRAATLAGQLGGLTLAGLTPLLRWSGLPASALAAIARFSTRVSGNVQARWTPGAGTPRLDLQLGLMPDHVPGRISLGGKLDLASAPGVLRLRQVQLQAVGAQWSASGELGNASARLETALTAPDLAALAPVLAPLLQALAPGSRLPALAGSLQMTASLRGALDRPALDGKLTLLRGRIGGLDFDQLRLDGMVGPELIQLRQGSLSAGRQLITLAGSAEVSHYHLQPGSPVQATLTVRQLDLARLQTYLGQHADVAGELSGTAHLAGTWGDPEASAALRLGAARWRDQAVSALVGDFHYQHGQISSSNLALTLRRTTIQGKLQLGLNDHSYRLDMTSPGVRLQDIAALQSPRLPLVGQIRFQLQGSGTWDRPQGQLIFASSGLQGGGEALGDAGGKLELANGRITFQLADILPNGSFNLSGTLSTSAPYDLDGTVNLKDYDFDVWLRRFTPAAITGHSHVSGSARIQGPLGDPSQLRARVQLDGIAMAISGLVLRNQAPVVLTANARQLALPPVRLTAQDTDVTLSGGARLGASLHAPLQLNLRADGAVNLALLRSFDPNLLSEGRLQVGVTVAGAWQDPQITGHVEISGGSLAERDFPIALDNIQGRLDLAGRRLQITQLTADTGSGTLALGGYAVDSPSGWLFDVNATGHALRLRYRGISATGDAQIRLSGQPQDAVVTGNAQLTRIGLDPNFDLAVFLAATQQAGPPVSPDSLLNHIRLDLHLTTGPQVEVATNLARLQVQADLQLRGTLANPSLLGRASAGEGKVLFAGNQYSVTKAQVQFMNPVRIEPLLDVALSTTVQPYDVTLNISGPVDKLAITYRSDPPLSSADVMSLLATGAPSQASAALAQMGTAASFSGQSAQMLSQALNDLASSRLQRLFGITQIRVNPDTGVLGPTGNGGSVTVQQQVSRNVKLTYTQNLSSSSQDIIQVDWTISRFLGITLSRDQFGLYGLKFTFSHRAR